MKLSKTQRAWFIGAACCILLAATAAILLDALLARWNPTVDLSGLGAGVTLSDRAKAALSDTAGTVTITTILPADSPAALPAGRLLRTFAQTSHALAGAKLTLSYVDPRLDTAAAAQLMGQGAEGTGLLLRRAARTLFVPERALLDTHGAYSPAEAESAITAALTRLSRPDGITLGWLTGHGEPSLDTTEPQTGFSGLRRALENEGYRLRELALDTSALENAIPSDLSALIVMAPRYPITAPERALLADWLARGGRLLVALPPSGDAGLGALLEQWGLLPGTLPQQPLQQTEGGAGLTSALSEKHSVTHELAGHAQLTFVAPRALIAQNTARGVTVTPLVQMATRPDTLLLPTTPAGTEGDLITVVAASERGSRAGSDLAVRPGRLIVAGEMAFLENRYILNHATANRDLLTNTLRWLTGLGGSGARSGSGVLTIGQTRRQWRTDFLLVAIATPFALCAILWFFFSRRRR